MTLSGFEQPDIVLLDKKEKTCVLIDTAISADSDFTQKEVRK